LLFARFTRPTAKIVFSRNAIIAPYENGWALMFRLVNLRNHDLTDVRAVVTVAQWVEENGSRRRRFSLLTLERPSIIFMPLHWVIVHPIGEKSPLRGLSMESLTAADRNSSAPSRPMTRRLRRPCTRRPATTSRTSSGGRFRDVYTSDEDHVAIDLTRLHDLEHSTVRHGVSRPTG
jgi:inward rectifier potassium channel